MPPRKGTKRSVKAAESKDDTEAKDTEVKPSQVHKLCAVKRAPRIQGDGMRASAFARNGVRWSPGTIITWAYWDPAGSRGALDAAPQRKIVEDAWKKWQAGISLKIRKVAKPEQAMIRIAFGYENGSWSYVGNENMNIPKSTYTMHFGWRVSDQLGTAEHEIGHALGFDHEHQHPKCELKWDEQAVIKYYMDNQGWSEAEVRQQVIKRVEDPWIGRPWNPKSIMHYPFPATLIQAPPPYNTFPGIEYNDHIHEDDFETIRLVYPLQPAAAKEEVKSKGGKKPKGDPAAMVAPAPQQEKIMPGQQKELIRVGSDYQWEIDLTQGGTFDVKVVGKGDVLVVVDAIGPAVVDEDDDPTERNQQVAAGFFDDTKSLRLTLVKADGVGYRIKTRLVHKVSQDSHVFLELSLKA